MYPGVPSNCPGAKSSHSSRSISPARARSRALWRCPFDRHVHIRRFDIAVNDPVIVGVAHRFGNLKCETHGITDSDRSVPQKDARRPPVDVFHDQQAGVFSTSYTVAMFG